MHNNNESKSEYNYTVPHPVITAEYSGN